MAKQELPVDFKDDVLQAEMAGKRKYRIIQNEDGTISLEDVTNYSQIGSNFGAAQMNATNLAVNESFDKNKVIDSLADIVVNEATGYAAGALAVRELNGKIHDKKVLWAGSGIFLNKSQSIPLSESLTKQKRGIVLILSRYENGVAQNYGYRSYFVPKECLDFGVDKPGFDIPLVKYSNNSNVVGSKYIYVSDNKIEGSESNGTSPNSGWVFRYAIGV